MNTALIVTTYNRPDALAVVLEGYCRQSDHDFELVVADDGSKKDTTDVVQQFARRAPFRVTHVWHEDRGFRAAAIRNRAVASTLADYIVFTDGDCVPSRHFVRAHRQLAEPGYFLGANRVLLSVGLTHRVLQQQELIHTWRGLDWLAAKQQPDGSWSLPDFPALTALPLWAFALSDHPQKSAIVSNAVRHLLRYVQPDGGIYKLVQLT